MPYKKNADVPDGVKVLPDDGITIWRKAFNAALKQYGDEETARKVAWAAVKKKYEKNGDEWVLKEGTDTSMEERLELLRRALGTQVAGAQPDEYADIWTVETFDDFVIFQWQGEFHRADYVIDDQGNVALSNVVKVERKVEYEPVQEEALPRSVLISHTAPITILEAKGGSGEGNKTFRVRGVALVDDSVSANGYYYSRDANDVILEETNEYLKRGNKSTVYSRHAKASYGLPVGKIDLLERVNNKVYYEARIADTAEGRDVQVLITEGVLGPTSIRSGDFEVKPVKVNGRQVMAVTRAILHGIDLVEQASIEGAGITEILTEGAVVEEVKEMDWKDLNLEELRKSRPDLLEAYDVDKYRGTNAKVRDLEAALEQEQVKVKALEEGQAGAIAKAVEEAKAPLLEQVNGLSAKIGEFTAEIDQRKLFEAITAAVKDKPYPELLEAALRNGMAFGAGKVEACVKAEDVTEERVKAAEALVESMKKALLVEGSVKGGDSFKGNVGSEGDAQLTEMQAQVVAMAS